MEQNPEESSCSRYCCSKFHQYHDTESLQPSRLTNDILPLFAETRYRNELEYSVLKPSLRLATQLLTSGGAALYICTIVDGDLHLVHDDGTESITSDATIARMQDIDGKPIFPKTARHPRVDNSQNPDELKRRATQILSNLTEMVDIEFANLPEDIRGYSKAFEGPLPSHLAPLWSRGVRSRISTAATVYFDLLRLTHRERLGRLSDKEREMLLLTQFSYATTLVHELGHALNCAVQGSIHRGEPFHGSCALAEGGYALEAAIFGGLLDGNITLTTREYARSRGLCSRAKDRVREGKYVKNALTLTQWPSGIYQHSYHAGHAIMGCRNDLPPYDEVARVPLSFIGDLFSPAYWAKEGLKRCLGPITVSTVGTWFIGTKVETDALFVCDLDCFGGDGTVRARLWDIIERGKSRASSRAPEKTAEEPLATVTSTKSGGKHDTPNTLKLVAMLGEEVRHAVKASLFISNRQQCRPMDRNMLPRAIALVQSFRIWDK